MSDPRHHLGQACENLAADWLSGHRWRVLARRQRSANGGEVDLIAIDPDGTLVAIEVRGRRTRRSGGPLETVDARRVGRLRRTLVGFARGSSISFAGLRVDLVSAEPVDGTDGRWRLRRMPGIG
jgi:putative endonuclease